MLTQASSYATRALAFVAAAGGKPVLVKDIAAATGAPAPYLAKIVQALARRGVLATQRGVGGGVTLTRPARDTSLYDLCEALHEPAVEKRCMLGLPLCSEETACPAHEFWSEHRACYIEFLRKTSVADVAAYETRRRSKTVPVSIGVQKPESADKS